VSLLEVVPYLKETTNSVEARSFHIYNTVAMPSSASSFERFISAPHTAGQYKSIMTK
jgi:hypothetical protein